MSYNIRAYATIFSQISGNEDQPGILYFQFE